MNIIYKILIILSVVYAALAFITNELNCSEWPTWARVILVIIIIANLLRYGKD